MNKLVTVLILIFLSNIVVAMADMPRDYYPDNLEGRNKGDLKTELHKLIKEHTRIEYGRNGTWVVFRESDIRDDGTVWDMYSTIERYFPYSGAAKGMNIEHSVPKSWWGDDYPYTVDGSFDLHHLVPADADANSAKSNYALGEVVGTPSFNNGVSKVGYDAVNRFNVFEPADEYKGDFARMYMYFVTCYQDYSWRSLASNMFITGSYPTLNSYSQELLLRWHRQDPVSKKERDRNNAVYRHQHNRNPFIDYPQMAEYIWGDSTEYAFRFVGEAVEAPKLNYATGDVLTFNCMSESDSRTMYITLKGVNVTSDLQLCVDNTTHFDVSPKHITAAQVADDAGCEVAVTYHPQDFGVHKAILIVSGKDFPNDIEVILQGLCMPEDPQFVAVDGLKTSYSRGDGDVTLLLRNCDEEIVWYIDGKQLDSNTLSPSALSVGKHIVQFVTPSVSGRVRVTITQ